MRPVGCQLTEVIFTAFSEFLMFSGYDKLPSQKMFWEQASDVQQKLVRAAMPQNKFRLILKNIHFCDNGDLDPADKCRKVRPLMNMIQERFKKFAIMTKNVNLDESMIPYYEKFRQKLKQQMPLKPIRSSYKVWCLNPQGGYLCNFEVYQGKCSENEYADDFGLGPSVVIDLAKSLQKGNFSVFIDNNFN